MSARAGASFASLLLLASCAPVSPPEADTGTDASGIDAGADAGAPRDAAMRDVGLDSGDAYAIDARAPGTLLVRTLGVQGFVLTYEGESVLTAPLFTRQSFLDVTVGAPIAADEAAIASGMAGVDGASVRAVLSGHAHYDHLIDVPAILAHDAPSAVLYANETARHVLAAIASDRDPGCATPAPTAPLDRARVIAVDDPLASLVDYTHCPDLRPAGAPATGTWIDVPGSHVRLYPLCTTHPAQFGDVHFAPGSIDEDQCDLPEAASGWLEGRTIAYVIDFLDAGTGEIAYRVYFQDAPATQPLGEIPPAIASQRAVDVAILCVGSNGGVESQPTDILANVSPRFVLSGHWENFFLARDHALEPIPLLDVDTYVMRAEAAVPGPPDVPMVVDGTPLEGRQWLVLPDAEIVIPPRP